MKYEEIKVGDHVTVAGGIRCFCIESKAGVHKDCELCAFEGTQRCESLRCGSTQRADGKDVLFVVKLNGGR